MKTKVTKILLGLLVLSLLVVGVVACGKDEDSGPGVSPEVGDTEAPTGETTPVHTHVFDKEVANDTYKKTDATCTAKAVYFKSCACGEKGSETFESGELKSHTYDQQVATEDYLKTAATYTEKGVYFYSCICGAKGSESFAFGNVALMKGLLLKEKTEEVVVAKYIGNEQSVVIPAEYNGKPVTGIGTSAFEGCKSLTSITIPSHIKYIQNDAFSDCSSLTQIVIEEGVQGIGESAFCGCTGLTHVTIPNSVSDLQREAFFGCSGLVSVTLGSGLSDSLELATMCFSGCDKLVEVKNLSSLTLTPGSDEYGQVAEHALNIYTADSGSSKLHTTADGYIFYSNDNATYLMGYTGSQTALTLPADYNGGTYEIYSRAFYGRSELTSVQIGSGATAIAQMAFGNCQGLTEVNLGSGVKTIGGYAFYNCSDLTHITVPAQMESIASDSFAGCNRLVEVAYENYNSNANIDNNSVLHTYDSQRGQSKLVTVGNGYLFYVNEELTNPSGRQYILMGYTGTGTVLTLPDHYEGYNYKIHSHAFAGRTDLIALTVGAQVYEIGDYAFSGCTALEQVNIGNAVDRIGQGAFSGCTSLTELNLGNHVQIIAPWAFEGCKSLTHVNIPDQVKTIAQWAFRGCTSLTGVTFGLNLESLDEDAFYQCYKLVEVYNRSDLSIVRDTETFGDLSMNALVIHEMLESESRIHTTQDGYVFYAHGDEVYLLGYTGSESSLTLPADYNGKKYEIYDYAFYGNQDVTSVVISGGVTVIGDHAFASCKTLTSVTITDGGVAEIGESAFASCIWLNDVSIGNSVVKIDSRAFVDCYSLSKMTVPANVQWIGAHAFSQCVTLSDLAFAAPDGWYYTGSESDWESRQNGTERNNLTDKEQAIYSFVTYSYAMYWYQL